MTEYPDTELIEKINYRDGRCCHACDNNKVGECLKHKVIVYDYAVCDSYINLGDKKE
jgi:hypothetical protein